MDDARPNPDALLEALQKQESKATRGKLKVFFGMAPGVGKTYAMLEAARRELAAGREVVVGYVETHGRQVAVQTAPGLPLARMDFVLMQQALANLLLNAALHTPAGTRVQVSAAVEDRTLKLSVADNGPGLPADALPRIFDKFYRAASAPAGGTGLGLSIVKGFVEAQGGSVSAANRPGGGAVFTLGLPLGEPPPAPTEENP